MSDDAYDPDDDADNDDADLDDDDDLDDDEDLDDAVDDDDDLDDDLDANTVAGATALAVLEQIVKSVVDDPDAVDIDVDDSSRGRVTLEVRVGPGDMGRVIGKRGRVANAIRTVVRAAASKDGVGADVEFAD